MAIADREILMNRLFIVVAFCSSFFTLDAHAQFRCKGVFIDNGYAKLDVKRYCGEPVMIDSYTTPATLTDNHKKRTVSCKSVDQWYYTYGANKTTYVIEFEGGFVTRVLQGRDKP